MLHPNGYVIILSCRPLITGIHQKSCAKQPQYIYIKDLATTTGSFSPYVVSGDVFTTSNLSLWRRTPDKLLVELMLQGIQRGFRIEFDTWNYLLPATSNLFIHNPQIVAW